jgi:chromosome partitioning protein
MIITIASFKGGVGKTTTAVHLAGKAPTLLLDGDENRSATAWAQRGSLPFRVADERQAVKLGREFEHLVIDTQARPNQEDLKALAEGCDLLIIPSTPDVLALDALILTVEALKGLRNVSYRLLLTIVHPRPNKDGHEARATLEELNTAVSTVSSHFRRPRSKECQSTRWRMPELGRPGTTMNRSENDYSYEQI